MELPGEILELRDPGPRAVVRVVDDRSRLRDLLVQRLELELE
jgi:hypothetical protein